MPKAVGSAAAFLAARTKAYEERVRLKEAQKDYAKAICNIFGAAPSLQQAIRSSMDLHDYFLATSRTDAFLQEYEEAVRHGTCQAWDAPPGAARFCVHVAGGKPEMISEALHKLLAARGLVAKQWPTVCEVHEHGWGEYVVDAYPIARAD